MFKTCVQIEDTRYTHSVSSAYFLPFLIPEWNNFIIFIDRKLGIRDDINIFKRLKLQPLEDTLLEFQEIAIQNELVHLYRQLLYFKHYNSDSCFLFESSEESFGDSLIVSKVSTLKTFTMEQSVNVPQLFSKFLSNKILCKRSLEVIFNCLHDFTRHTTRLLEIAAKKKEDKHKVEKKPKARLIFLYSEFSLDLFMMNLSDFHSTIATDSFMFLALDNFEEAKEDFKTRIAKFKNRNDLFNRPIVFSSLSSYANENSRDYFIDTLFSFFQAPLQDLITKKNSILARFQNVILVETTLPMMEAAASSFSCKPCDQKDLVTIGCRTYLQQCRYLYPNIFLGLTELFEDVERCFKIMDTTAIAKLYLSLLLGNNDSHCSFMFDSEKAKSLEHMFLTIGYTANCLIKPKIHPNLDLFVFAAMKETL